MTDKESVGNPSDSRTRGLLRGGRPGRRKEVPNRVTKEVKALAHELVQGPAYLKNLKKRLETGKCAPAVECLLWQYAYGKPKEQEEQTSAGAGT